MAPAAAWCAVGGYRGLVYGEDDVVLSALFCSGDGVVVDDAVYTYTRRSQRQSTCPPGPPGARRRVQGAVAAPPCRGAADRLSCLRPQVCAGRTADVAALVSVLVAATAGGGTVAVVGASDDQTTPAGAAPAHGDDLPLGREIPVPVAAPALSARDDTTVVHLVGDVDLAGAPGAEAALRSALDDARDRGVGAVHADLSGVGVVDSTGLGALVRARREVRAAGLEFVVLNPAPAVRRLFAVTRLDAVFTVVDDQG
jgi:anti-sigma B factor antagonist